ncbi:LVIVD repeat-containing protein [Phytoactinopolyspora limicola]|uniref:LVIVD repeat-containing protein n=1 Tax=Phytoactinopolyspora limicola TaxID=2715536 RepID=UPI00140BEE83|nr:hypothetical protein [Phytoactinopolyspora limicola]
MPTPLLGRRPRRALQAAVLGVAMVLMSLGSAGPSIAQSDELDVDEVSHSKYIRSVANVPRQEAVDNDWHTDIAFWGNYAYQGSYGGVTIYDITQPHRPTVVGLVHCPGGQGDVSISPDGDLLFVSVDYPRTDDVCGSPPTSPANPTGWEGIRIFDVSDVGNPHYVTSVRTDCGSHTHTLVPGTGNDEIYLYISSYGPAPVFPHCQPPHDSISIIEVPLDNPADASVIAKPILFPDGGAPRTSGCHDITVFPEEDLAAGACMGEGILMDITDPADPYVITNITDANFAFYHSATFTNDAQRVVFTDELGGGVAATCNEAVGPHHGANAIYDIVGEGDDRELVFRSYYKIPRHQQSTENCVAHNGSLVPVKGRDIMVQAWYQGGVSVWEFTDPDNPVEIAYWERGPLSTDVLQVGGSWSAYWYNGFIYSSDMIKGLDVLKLTGLQGVPSANRIKFDLLNAQTQYRYAH